MKITSLDKIQLQLANKLEREHGAWIWDGLLYEQNGIVNPLLQILPNRAGNRLRQILSLECESKH